jgi:hypothetical protein
MCAGPAILLWYPETDRASKPAQQWATCHTLQASLMPPRFRPILRAFPSKARDGGNPEHDNMHNKK